MLETIDLSRRVMKAEYHEVKPDLELRLTALQREVKERGIPVLIVFEGWNAASIGYADQ